MNIHTVEISRPLGPDLMRLFCRTQQWFQFPGKFRQNSRWTDISDFIISPPQHIERSKDILRSDMYPAAGIQQVKLLRNPSKQGYFYLVVIVNLKSLYRRDMTVESFQCTEERLQGCCNAFETVMGNFF